MEVINKTYFIWLDDEPLGITDEIWQLLIEKVLNKQKPLGKEFEQVLHDNLYELMVYTPNSTTDTPKLPIDAAD